MKAGSKLSKFISFTGMILPVLLITMVSFAQNPASTTKPNSRTAASPRIDRDKLAIDSLKQVILNMEHIAFRTDSLLNVEKSENNRLHEELMKLDDYRKKLEAKNSDFVDDNLRLNQSNRILIIFNSLVAVLLVVSLIFFLKRLSRKKPVQNSSTAASPQAVSETRNSAPVTDRFASFEDRLIQLERLGKLREKGLLTDEEFTVQKNRILGN
jgi:hypothetical protein